MPTTDLTDSAKYQPPLLFRQADLHTIYPAMFRRTATPPFIRERISTADSDFLDLDWLRQGNKRLAILSHGLEGSSRSRYCKGMAQALSARGFDILAWNFRGCSGEPNRHIRSYHSGLSEDLHTVITHALIGACYREICLIGFSVGGNITLKYLAESAKVPSAVQAAVCISTPCDLEASSREMARPRNILYMRWFLWLLHEKIRKKIALFPGEIDDKGYSRFKNFYDFDSRYTAPFFGYKSAEEYWRSNSAKPLLEKIKIPTLMLSAEDDSFLGPLNYPVAETARNSNISLEIPRFGGHVGFMAEFGEREYWSEKRTAQFLATVLS